jgi:CheY-like chemotaxis protein
MDRLLKLSEAARLLSISPKTLKSWCKQGKVRYSLTKGGHFLVFQSSVAKILREKEAVKLHIFVVEDVLDSRDVLEYFLRLLGYEVTTCSNGEEAWDIAQRRNFDAYIIDTYLNGEISGTDDPEGIKLCWRIRALDPVTPIIFYSAVSKPARNNGQSPSRWRRRLHC